jgi:HPt (histidine-containing phosphotransfer) domain-containing protein
MTAHAMTGDREKSLQAGMNDHITKPIEPDELYASLIRWVRPGDRPVSEVRAKNSHEISEIDLPENLPGIKVSSGLKRVAGNRKLYKSLLKDFAKENENFIEQIQDKLDQDDIETASRMAHTLKGVAGNIGASALFDVARILEKAIKDGEADQFSDALQKVDKELTSVLHGLKEMLARDIEQSVESIPTTDIEVDIEALAPCLREISKFLDLNDPSAESVFEPIKKELLIVAPQETKEFEQRLESYDFSGAMEALKSIVKVLHINL